MTSWEGFASACRADRELENFLRRDLDTFDEILREAWSAWTRKTELEAEKRKATRKLNDVLYKAKEQVRHLRLGIQLHFGPRNERLEMFGMKPLQAPRPRKPPKP